ncbi:MAG: type IV pilus twitching motility protein PilT [Candidatus Gracilibacteria bacterium]|nr:type IV pilus twitching motility protein PilT [Candidatus Gracilibacteria bacterium]
MDNKELLYAILQLASKEKYPDIHLTSNHYPILRNHSGELFNLESNGELKFQILTKEIVKEFIEEIAGNGGLHKFEENKELDTSIAIENGDRYRVNCYMDTAGYSIALRIIPSKIPTLEELGLGKQIEDMCKKSKGLILVTGPTGSGKSTNLAAMIDYINTNYKKHIITIEDPVEFAFISKSSLVNQREVGANTSSFANAIRASLREDPDVIMVGEMRDPETIKAAITLAETGHLVLSTLHTNDSVQTVDRIVDIFPSAQQKQIRMQLSQSLIGIVSQRLVPRTDKEGRIAAREILITNDAVKNLIIGGKTHQLYSVLEVGQKEGMILMDKYLIALYKKGIISRESLISYSRDKDGVEMLIG